MIVDGRDIPLVLLRPRHDRKISKREYARIRASILAVGLIEPLLVFPENDYYVILNGYQRYRILLELGVETVPCIFAPEKESFTSNRMVNRLSPFQEGRMIKKSLDGTRRENDCHRFGNHTHFAPAKCYASEAIAPKRSPPLLTPG